MNLTTAGDAVVVNAFHDAMLDVYVEAKKHCRYNATAFLQMVKQQGGLATAKQLLQSEAIAYGLEKLWEHGRLDLSVEAVALQPKWARLFTEQELQKARARLKQLDYVPAL